MTCSLHACLADPAELQRQLCAAVANVAEQSLFAFAEPCAQADFDERAAAVDGWVRARVAFRGAADGALSCALAEPLARELLVAFLGESPDGEPADAALFDFAGELANMVCGDWLTHACPDTLFALQRPEVSRLAAPPGEPGTLILVNEAPVWCGVHVDKAAA